MAEVKTVIGAGGRIVIPAGYRKALGVRPGDEVLLLLEEDEIRIVTARQAIRRAQALVRRHIPEGRSLSKELIRERREESARA